jgi:glyoxylase-like metal-dependent hydrolase (beta-lactamase superfamily II)
MSKMFSNRRDFLQALVGGAAGVSFTYSAFGQAAQAPPSIKATKLSDDLAVLMGDGGNVAVVIAPDGLMMIDGGLPNRTQDMLKAVEEVDAHKVRILFNTHWHFDHVGCNEALGKSGAKIIAHENVKKRLSVKVDSEALGRSFDPLKVEGLPAETFTKGGKLTFGKQKIDYTHFVDGHTDGDAYLFLPKANVLHTGDLLFSGMYPVIDYSTGGWIGGMASACDTMLKVGDAKTRVIPGHGALASKDDLRASRDMLHTVHERLAAMAKQGKTVDEVVASAPTKDLDEQWGKARPAAGFVKQAYNGLLHRNHTT